MNNDELLKAIDDIQRLKYTIHGYMEYDNTGDYIHYDDLIELITKLYEQSK